MKAITGLILVLILSCQGNLKDQSFALEAKPCLGRCLVYALKIDVNGAYSIEQPHTTSPVQGRLSKTQKREFKQLLKALPKTDTLTYLGRANVYDLPEISLQYGASKAIVKGRQFAPPPYKRIIAWSDQLVKERPK